MYKKQLTLFAIILFVVALFVGFTIWHVTDKDRVAYQELLESSNLTQKPLITYSQQVRKKVCKEIWYQAASPLYFRIESDDSELFFFHQEGEVEVVEQLETVHCLMQEELYYDDLKPMQLVRYMEAKRASYDYNTQLFVAEEVKLWRYRLEGHEPVLTLTDQEPLMSGTALSVEFTIKGKKLDFQAHHLRAKFNPKEELL